MKTEERYALKVNLFIYLKITAEEWKRISMVTQDWYLWQMSMVLEENK